MAKLSKKSTAKAGAAVATAQPVKKGKRGSEVDIDEKSAKKLKNELVEQKPIDIQSEKKFEEKVKVSAKNVKKAANVPTKVAAGKNGHATASKKDESSEESFSDEEMSSDEGVTADNKASLATTEVSLADTMPTDEASDGSDSEYETGSDEDGVRVNKPSVAVKENATVTNTEKEVETKDESESEYETSSDEEVAANAPAVPSKTGTESLMKNEVESNDESGSGSDYEDDTSSDENVASAKESSALAKNDNKTVLKEKVELKDDEDIAAKDVKPLLKEVDSGEDSQSDDENSGSDDDDDGTDVKMTDATSTKTNSGKGDSLSDKTPNTHATPKEQTSGTTIFIGNLSFAVEQADVENFFKDTGEVVEVRFAMSHDNTFRGFGHIQFATLEQAAKALDEMNGKELLGRPVRLAPARERGSYAPKSGDKDAPFQKGEGSRIHTVFIRGFDKNDDEDKIRSRLEERFGSCGEIRRLTIPKDDEGDVKGIAYIDFKDKDAFNKALELDGSEIGNDTLSVEEAKPKGDGRSGGWGGGRGSRDRFSDRGFGGRRGRTGRGGGRFEGFEGGRFEGFEGRRFGLFEGFQARGGGRFVGFEGRGGRHFEGFRGGGRFEGFEGRGGRFEGRGRFGNRGGGRRSFN